MPTFYVHIGTHKTGSTALQNYLHNNRTELSNSGILYPEAGLHGTGHHSIAWSAAREERELLAKYFQSIRVEAEKIKAQKIILSSEEFEFVPGLDTLRSCLPADTQIILYCRRPDRYLESEFNQHVRMYDLRFVGDIYRFLFRVNFMTRCDYLAICKKWGSAFGPKNIHLVSYDNARKTDSLYKTFHSAVGINDSDKLSQPNKSELNLGMTAPGIYYLSRLNQEALGKQQHFQLIKEIILNFQDSPKQSLLEKSDRIRIYESVRKRISTLESLYNLRLFDHPRNDVGPERAFCDYSSVDPVILTKLLGKAKAPLYESRLPTERNDIEHRYIPSEWNWI